MDKLLRDTLFVGLTDRDLAEAVIVEMRRRGLLGCLFMFPNTGGASVFVSSSPAGALSDLSVGDQLSIFAEVASQATSERRQKLESEVTMDSPTVTKWAN
jgi:hypothetical protein